ncbi:hypothetical protein JTB14_012976 [Gonioctena quinquepunctata]|nr:hypothetical protein JTB14_012976 [Gonioctena quinquepunctata]
MWIVNIGVLYFITLLNFSHSYSGYTRAESKNHFPKDFIFGASTSAYQIEGAWNVDGKGENIWDRFVHVNRSRILNNDTADIACDSYHKYKEDVALAASLGFSMYRFSISWARILPTGNKLNVNEAGLKYYENLVEEINKYNMKAMVTLYHWDLPQAFKKNSVDGRRLKKVAYWITINEPKQLCNLAYETGGFAPGVYNKFYECVYSVLMCHASVYHMYKKEFADREGKMSIALDFPWSEPKTNSANDRAAASRNIDFEFGIYADPIILGDYPKVVKERAIKRSLVNSTLTELHVLSPDEIKFIKGTFDYMAINHYTTYYVQDAPEGHSLNAYENDKQVITSSNPAWEHDR